MKTAIVTGASGNLGQAVTKKLMDAGYRIIGTVIPNDPVVMDFPAEQFEKIVVDLTSEEDAQKFVDSVAEKYKSIDVAVLTVGGFAMGKMADTKTGDVQKLWLNFNTACPPLKRVNGGAMLRREHRHRFFSGFYSRPQPQRLGPMAFGSTIGNGGGR